MPGERRKRTDTLQFSFRHIEQRQRWNHLLWAWSKCESCHITIKWCFFNWVKNKSECDFSTFNLSFPPWYSKSFLQFNCDKWKGLKREREKKSGTGVLNHMWKRVEDSFRLFISAVYSKITRREQWSYPSYSNSLLYYFFS